MVSKIPTATRNRLELTENSSLCVVDDFETKKAKQTDITKCHYIY